MKKALAVCLIALLALALMAAHAEKAVDYDDPINPYFRRGGVAPVARLQSAIRLYRSNGLAVTISEPSGDPDDAYDDGLTWTATASGGSGGYEYQFYLIEPNSQFGERSVHGYQYFSSDNTFHYQFMVPGEYQLLCYVMDSAGATAWGHLDFEIAGDDAHPSTAQIVSDLVAECRAAGVTGDYDTALWLYDWLTHHARYDYSYSYYSADSVLVRGTGVCDGYCKAFQLLLEEAGMEADCMVSSTHAWNIAKLDGAWYQFDPTWDDPGNSTGPVSGNEQHLFFGLPDEIMMATKDHDYTPSQPCTSYEDNYFIHSGKVSLWLVNPGGNLNASGSLILETTTLLEDVSAALGDYWLRFAVAVPDYYRLENGKYGTDKKHIVYGLSAYALSQRDWVVDGLSLLLDVAYDKTLACLNADVLLGDDVIVLPSDLTTIDEYAFSDDDSIVAVKIPASVTTIGDHAFADCDNLWRVDIPDSVVKIARNAFIDSPCVNIVCPEDSDAARFADGNNLHCIIENVSK